MTTYAIAERVPKHSRFYLTAGKEYEAKNVTDAGFEFVDDNGVLNWAGWSRSLHLGNGKWKRVEK